MEIEYKVELLVLRGGTNEAYERFTDTLNILYGKEGWKLAGLTKLEKRGNDTWFIGNFIREKQKTIYCCASCSEEYAKHQLKRSPPRKWEGGDVWLVDLVCPECGEQTFMICEEEEA